MSRHRPLALPLTFLALALALLLLPLPALAQPPAGYYALVDASSSATLRLTLHEAIDDHTRFPYSSSATDTWDILEAADVDPVDPSRVLDVYRNASYDKRGGGNNDYNREHSWPKSYGFPRDGATNYPYTDCHHLFIADTRYNSSRSNKPYVPCPSCEERPTAANAGAGGTSGMYPADSNWTGTDAWETWRGRRGDVARALFYMDVRYEGGHHGVTGAREPDLVLTNDLSLVHTTGANVDVAYMGHLDTLLAWHREDPVDERERHRNDVVAFFQGNRNPFIDHPEWAECLFAGDCQPAPLPSPTVAGLADEDAAPAAPAAPSAPRWVLPDPRVVHFVHVRERPTTSSDSIARLHPGDRARLVAATVTRWYEVELADGTRGFVSRSWTRIETALRHRRLDELRIHLVNVGPGNCIFIECPGEDSIPILNDCGQHFERETNTGRSADETADYLRPLLDAHEAPPTLVVSHPHQDHYEYVPTVLRDHDPVAIWLAGEKDDYRNRHNDFDTWLARQAAAGTPIHDGLPPHWSNAGDPIEDESLSCGDAEVSVLTVNVPRRDGTNAPNANSLVLLVRYGDFTAVLPGDAEGVTEKSALDNFPNLRDVTFLAAAHHGAETHHSNDPPWVSRISPRAVVYNAGWAFRHPRCVVTDRYRPHLATVTEHPMFCDPTKTSTPSATTRAEYTTELAGPIVVTTDGTTTTLDCPESLGCGDRIDH